MTKKLVAILNKKITVGQAMNALAHMVMGLAKSNSNIDFAVISYTDKDGNKHWASKHPFIILKAKNSNKIRTLREEVIKKNIIFSTFTNTMTVGTWQEQIERSKGTPESELEYFGICLFGDAETIDPLTKKFSLWQ